MSRFIDAEKLKEEIRKNFDNLEMRIIINTIINEMPKEDVQEIVRCKDCIMRDKNGICQFLCAYIWDDFFCGNGEKPVMRGENNEDN